VASCCKFVDEPLGSCATELVSKDLEGGWRGLFEETVQEFACSDWVEKNELFFLG
jgi:hypothetical protein